MDIIYNAETNIDESLNDYYLKAAKYALLEEGVKQENVQISVSFVNEDEIKELNRQYRDKDKVTDVLSFPQYDEGEDLYIEGDFPFLLGDVVICMEVAKAQAEDFGHSINRELVYLFVHSLFHLLGYDHMDEEEKQIMRQKEELVLAKLDLQR